MISWSCIRPLKNAISITVHRGQLHPSFDERQVKIVQEMISFWENTPVITCTRSLQFITTHAQKYSNCVNCNRITSKWLTNEFSSNKLLNFPVMFINFYSRCYCRCIIHRWIDYAQRHASSAQKAGNSINFPYQLHNRLHGFPSICTIEHAFDCTCQWFPLYSRITRLSLPKCYASNPWLSLTRGDTRLRRLKLHYFSTWWAFSTCSIDRKLKRSVSREWVVSQQLIARWRVEERAIPPKCLIWCPTSQTLLRFDTGLIWIRAAFSILQQSKLFIFHSSFNLSKI